MVLLSYFKRQKENVKVMKPFPCGLQSFGGIGLTTLILNYFEMHSFQSCSTPAWQTCRLVLLGWGYSAGLVLGLRVWRHQKL